MPKQPEARKTDQPLALSSSAVLGHNVPERCRDCGLTLVPWLRLWCTKCVQQHLKG